MFKEDIKIKILDEEYFNKVKEILVREGYKFPTHIMSDCYYLTAYQSETLSYVNYGHSPAGFITHENKEYVLWGSNKLVPKVGVTLPQPVESNKVVEKEFKMTERNKEPKNKPKTQSQLVFTYTNGKKYVVRGLQDVKVFLNGGSKIRIDYNHSTFDSVKRQQAAVSVYVTNELVKVEKINTDNSVEVILDLSSSSTKGQEGAKKPRGNARSKEEYEAMLEAKKATDERNKALVEAKARELATKMFKEGKI